MKEEIRYKGNLVKGDLIEIYAKAIANLGPFNHLYVKSFDYSSSNRDRGMSGFHLEGFGSPLFAYITRQIMDANDPVEKCVMERSSIPNYVFRDKASRRITLENIGEYETRAEIEDSQRGIIRVRKVLDQVLKEELDPQMEEELEFLLKENH